PGGPGDRRRRPGSLALAEREDGLVADVVVRVVTDHSGEEPGAALAAHLSQPEQGVLARLTRGRGRGELLQGLVRVGVAVHREGGDRLRARTFVAALAGPGESREPGDALLRLDAPEPDEAAAAGVQRTVLREAANLVDLPPREAEEDVHPLIGSWFVAVLAPPALVPSFETAGRGVEILVEAAEAPLAGHHGDRVAHPERLSAAGAGLLQRRREPAGGREGLEARVRDRRLSGSLLRRQGPAGQEKGEEGQRDHDRKPFHGSALEDLGQELCGFLGIHQREIADDLPAH